MITRAQISSVTALGVRISETGQQAAFLPEAFGEAPEVGGVPLPPPSLQRHLLSPPPEICRQQHLQAPPPPRPSTSTAPSPSASDLSQFYKVPWDYRGPARQSRMVSPLRIHNLHRLQGPLCPGRDKVTDLGFRCRRFGGHCPPSTPHTSGRLSRSPSTRM